MFEISAHRWQHSRGWRVGEQEKLPGNSNKNKYSTHFVLN